MLDLKSVLRRNGWFPALLLPPVLLCMLGCSRPAETSTAAPALRPEAYPEEQLKACQQQYAGRYVAESKLPSHPQATRRQVLVLEKDWRCTLTTEYPGSRHPATVEWGTWRCDRGKAHVLLTGGEKTGPERTQISFQWKDGQLEATAYDRQRRALETWTMRRE